MSVLKLILPALMVVCSCSSLCSQTTGNAVSDSISTAQVQASRQFFWDSLPKRNGWTNDFEKLFSEIEIQMLDSIITVFEKETSNQICIVTVDSFHISKERFDDLALHIGNTWGIGQQDKSNGIIICISKVYRRIRIYNGRDILPLLSMGETKEIISQHFIARFKTGDYFNGTLNGLNAIVGTIRQKLNTKTNN